MVEVGGSNPPGPTSIFNFYAAFRATPLKTALHTTVRPKLDSKNNPHLNQ